MKRITFIPDNHSAMQCYENTLQTIRESIDELQSKYNKQVMLNDKLIWDRALRDNRKFLKAMLLMRFEIEDAIREMK